ncbi:MAG: AAA family ATPase [Clostridia bacterium]|nr:AAA family ATPase [Clostridia bacterium]
MKNLYLIGGTMGVGKTTVSQQLKRLLPRSVFLDGDWCWDAHPFVVNDETKAMVMDNICHTLGNFLGCSAYENVIFCWVMHEQKIVEDILSALDTRACRVHCISLVCSEEALRQRLEKDIEKGLRTQDILERSAARLPLYEKMDTVKIDVSDISPSAAAQRIAAL